MASLQPRVQEDLEQPRSNRLFSVVEGALLILGCSLIVAEGAAGHAFQSSYKSRIPPLPQKKWNFEHFLDDTCP